MDAERGILAAGVMFRSRILEVDWLGEFDIVEGLIFLEELKN